MDFYTPKKQEQTLDLGTVLMIARQSKNIDGFTLDGFSLAGHTLPDLSFRLGTAKMMDFSRAILTGSDFTESDFASSHFEKADVSKCIFSKSNLNVIKAKKAVFDKAKFEDMEIRSAHFEKASFLKASFKNVRLVNCYFDEATFKGATFENVFVEKNCRFFNADFSGVDMSGIDWYQHKGNPFSPAITEGVKGLKRPNYGEANTNSRELGARLSHDSNKWGYGTKADAVLHGTLSTFRENINVTHKALYLGIGMSERTYFHKLKTNGFTHREIMELSGVLNKKLRDHSL